MIFNEIYGSYFNVVASVIEEAVNGNLTDKRLSEIVIEKAFDESITVIPDKLKSGEWPLINDDCSTPLLNTPSMPLTDLQKMWLKGILADPRIKLFNPSEKGLEDVEPLFNTDSFIVFDRYLDGDPYEDESYINHFRTVLKAIKEKRGVRVTFRGKKNRQTRFVYPIKLEYSLKDDKFRLLSRFTRKEKALIINMARIESVELLEMKADESVSFPKVKRKKVVLKLIDERNALERAMLHFSDLEKKTVKTGEREYEITLWYMGNDETEILIRILSFGPRIRVVSPNGFVDKIRQRLMMQKELDGGGLIPEKTENSEN